MAKKQFRVRRKSNQTVQPDEDLDLKCARLSRKLAERSEQVEKLTKDAMRNKADLEAKDKLIEQQYSNAERMTQHLEELTLKNRQLEELLEQRATETQKMSIDVSKMIRDHFNDYESHSITAPSL